MPKKPDQILKSVRQRNYLAKDFDGLKSVIVNYAQQYYPNALTDFSENSLGGLLLDMAAYVGDNMSFYLDHQFNELDPTTVIETKNLQRLLISSGVKARGASPAIVDCTFLIEIPTNGNVPPAISKNLLPIIRAGSVFSSADGINFNLLEDVDFSKTDPDGNLIANIVNGRVTSNGTVLSFFVSTTGACTSGDERTVNFDIGSFVPFRQIVLNDSNISELIKVVDTDGNVYYEVNDLSENVVYKNIPQYSADQEQSLQLISAPYRFIKNYNIQDQTTTLTFGGGNASTLQDDAIPDPTEFAISLPNTKTFSRKAINPQNLLNTRTLGVANENVSLSITYRYGGGLTHNVTTNSITLVKNLNIFFPLNPSPTLGQAITNSLEVTNLSPAVGGENPLTSDELKTLTTTIKNSQERIVTKEDLLARVYTMPTNFGRVFRAASRSNPDNPLATRLYITSRDKNGNLAMSSDALKLNLVKYLNQYRMISDAIDIMDSPIVNIKISFSVVINPQYNSSLVIKDIINEMQNFFNYRNLQIDKPINITELINIIFSIDGTISLPSENGLKITNLVGIINNKNYSNYSYDIKNATLKQKGIILPPVGGIFEVKYPNFDIEGFSV
jgi:hypothetical protein